MTARLSPSLSALLGAAAALLPAAHARAAENDEAGTLLSYRFSDYDEDSLNGVIGDGKRYHVLSQILDVDSKFADGQYGLKVNATHEVMSGSSPWFVLPDEHGKAVQVLSGATIHDRRNAMSAAFTTDPATATNTTYSLTYSTERDYHALAAGIERSQALNASWTLGYGGSYSHDTIDPVDAAAYHRIDHATKNTASAFASLGVVLDKASVLQMGVQLNLEHGFLSDPYKLFSYGDDIVAERRPDQRAQGAALLRYRRSFADLDGALHVDYRFAMDSWGTHSHTIDVAWYQTLGAGWRLVPELRYYSQAAARFYAPFVLSADGRNYFSSDYRLATYGAVSPSLNVRKSFGHWELSLGAQRYHSAQGLALDGDTMPVPALVNFTRVYAGFDYGFD